MQQRFSLDGNAFCHCLLANKRGTLLPASASRVAAHGWLVPVYDHTATQKALAYAWFSNGGRGVQTSTFLHLPLSSRGGYGSAVSSPAGPVLHVHVRIKHAQSRIMAHTLFSSKKGNRKTDITCMFCIELGRNFCLEKILFLVGVEPP